MKKKKKIEPSAEQMYKLALFLVVKNSTVLPHCVKSKNKTMREINELSVLTMDEILEQIEYNLVIEQFEQGGGIL